MRRNHAETMAVDVLTWLARDDELTATFLGATGLSPDDLRRRADDPELLAAVLDFVLMDDAWVLGAAGALGVQPSSILKARGALPGGEAVHWT